MPRVETQLKEIIKDSDGLLFIEYNIDDNEWTIESTDRYGGQDEHARGKTLAKLVEDFYGRKVRKLVRRKK